MEKESFDYDKYLENQRLERQKKVRENFDLDEELRNYVNRFMPDIDGLKEKFLDAINEKSDTDTLRLLVHDLEIKINYLAPKSRDTEEQKDYLAKLELMRQKLSEIIDK